MGRVDAVAPPPDSGPDSAHRSVLDLAAQAEAADGVAPLDEATTLALRHRPQTVRTVEDPDGVALQIGREVAVVVRPAARGRGLGTRLAASLLDGVEGPLVGWAHGSVPGAAQLAASQGFRAVRELWVMRRPAGDLPPLPEPHAGVTVRSFRPGDEAELLRVNAAAFAHHPEQGSLTLAGLHERMAEPWFDPEGLLEAWDDDGSLLGFHWTKRHSPSLGEVYVVGIAPQAQGRGLGRLLTLAGLHHLADTDEVHLYVERDNGAAVRLYSGLGFTHAAADTHVQYARS